MKKAARPASVLLVILVMSGLFLLFFFVLIPELGRTFLQLGDSAQIFFSGLKEKVSCLFQDNPEMLEWIDSWEIDWDRLTESLLRLIQNGAGQMVGSAVEVVRRIVRSMITFFVAFAFACYVLLQRERLAKQGKKVIYGFFPRGKAGALLEILELSGRTFAGFLTGQCVEALILGGLFVVALLLCRIPYAVLIGVIIAVTALVPLFGAFAGCAMGALLILIEEPSKVLWFLIIFLILQQLEGNLIYPKVVGNSVGLPSIWVLAAVTVGGKLMGVVGMLIFIPLAAVSYALFREIVYLLLKKRQIDPEDI